MSGAKDDMKDPLVMSDTSEAASVKTIDVEQKALENDTKPEKKMTLNHLWKDLDAMYGTSC